MIGVDNSSTAADQLRDSGYSEVLRYLLTARTPRKRCYCPHALPHNAHTRRAPTLPRARKLKLPSRAAV